MTHPWVDPKVGGLTYGSSQIGGERLGTLRPAVRRFASPAPCRRQGASGALCLRRVGRAAHAPWGRAPRRRRRVRCEGGGANGGVRRTPGAGGAFAGRLARWCVCCESDEYIKESPPSIISGCTYTVQ